MVRFKKWFALPELQKPLAIPVAQAHAMASDNGRWRGVSVLVSQVGEWTLFNNMTGYLDSIPAREWLSFAGDHEFVLASYNDCIEYGRLLVIADRKIARDFCDYAAEPGISINKGKLPFERDFRIKTWMEVEKLVLDDPWGCDPGEVLLWIFHPPKGW